MDSVRCPVGTSLRPVLSRNEADVQCGISGRLLPQQGAICCGDYSTCQIWVTAKKAEGQSQRQQALLQEDPHNHALDSHGLAREVARA